MIRLLVLLYIPTKYYQNTSKGIKVKECTRTRLQYFCFRGDNYITNKVRVVSLARNTPNGPPLYPYEILSNNLAVWELWPAQDFDFRGDNYIMKTVRVVSLARDMPTGPPFLPNIIKICLRVSKLWSVQGCVYGRTPC